MNKVVLTDGLLPWERATVPEEDMQPGLIAYRNSFKAFILCIIAFVVLYIAYPSALLNTSILATVTLICARLISIDLSHMILPNIYVILIAILGVAHHYSTLSFTWESWDIYIYGMGIGLGLPLATAALASLSGEKGMIGGGDIKMMMAAGLWLGNTLIIPYILAVSLMSLCLTIFRKETQPMPMGPALCLTFWLFILYVNDATILNFIQLFLEL